MRKTVYGFLMLVLLLPILAACGASDTGTSTSSGAASTAGSTAASGAASTGPTTVVTEEPATASTAASTEASNEASTEASAEASGAAGGSGEGLRVGLVTDVGKVNDGTFNQSAYEGLQRAEQELGVQIDFIETQQPTDYEKNLEQFASGGYDLVIGVGFLMGEAMATVASRYPDVKFAIVDFAYGDNPPANVKGLVFREDQSGFIAGTIAALISQNSNVGVVAGIEDVPAVKKFVEGYTAGAQAQKPDIRVQAVYTPSFTDPATGAEQARSQIAEGADVIFGAGGQTGSGGIAAAAQQGVFVIGVDTDEYRTTFKGGSEQGADKIVSSALKRVDNAVFQAVKDVADGSFTNELYVGDAANGGVDYAECHDACAAFPADVKSKVDAVKQGLADGSINTGVQQ